MPPRTQPAKLLLIDDVPGNLLALESVLAGPEYKLLTANSGLEGMAVLQDNPDVALILLDVQMPGMDGFEVSRRIKQFPEYAEIPIIFITAIHKEDPFVRQGYKAGGVDYFSKPFDPEVLKTKVGIYASFRQRTALLDEKERQLRESEKLLAVSRRLPSILERVPVGVIVFDAEGRVHLSSEKVLRFLSATAPAENATHADFLRWWENYGHFLRNEDGPLMRALSAGRSSHNEIVSIDRWDGTSKSVVISATPLRGSEGHIAGVVLVLQDVSANLKIEAEIEKGIVNLVSPLLGRS